jgi:uncharacterized protein with HEPN domain
LSFNDPVQCLEDILQNIARIERFTQGMDEKAFRENEETIFAVQYALLALSEAARRMGERAEVLCPGLPWRNIRGLGNWLRHGYDRIDTGIIWVVVEKDLAPLKKSVAAALHKLQASGPDAPPPPISDPQP